MRPSSQILWYWARGLFFAGVVGWLIVYTGVSFLMSILVAIFLEFASIPEPYFRSTEGETISVPLLISQIAGLLVWAAYACGHRSKSPEPENRRSDSLINYSQGGISDVQLTLAEQEKKM